MKIFFEKEIKIFLTFFIISSLFVHWGGWYENSVFALTRAIVDEHRFEIDSFANQTSDRAFYKCKYYSDKAPLTSIIGIPSYLFAKTILKNDINTTSFKVYENNKTTLYAYKNPGVFAFTTMIIYTIGTSVFFTALSVILFYRILYHFFNNEKHVIILTFVFGFATLIFPYSLNVNSQPLALFFLLLSFYFLLKQQKSPKLTCLIFSGVSLGLSFTAYYSIAAALFFLITYAFITNRNIKKILIFLLAIGISLLPLISYNYLLTGDPFTFVQKYEDPNVFPVVPKQIFEKYGFETPRLGVIFQLLIGLYRGLFFYYPILILSFVGLFYMWRMKKFRKESILFLLIFISYVIFTSSRTTWYGGYSFGPRYIYLTIPFLIIPLGFTFVDFKDRIFKLVFFAFLILSIFSNILSLQILEDELVDSKTFLIQEKYQKITDSFGTLPSSLYGYYLPSFLQYGPRSLIVENLIEGHLDMDIRDIPFSRDWKFPYISSNHIPYLPFIILIAPLTLIWWKELRNLIKAMPLAIATTKKQTSK